MADNSWLAIYSGEDRVEMSGNKITMRLDPPYFGARLKSNFASSNAKFCADVKTEEGVNQGGVFAMYAISDEPTNRDTDKWWELDFEFLGKSPDAVWINNWAAGKEDPKLAADKSHSKKLPVAANSKSQRYCIDWDLSARSAKWTVDETTLYEVELDDSWGEPLYAVFSSWAADESTKDWLGALGVTKTLTTEIENAVFEDRSA